MSTFCYCRSQKALKVMATDRIVLYALNRREFSLDGNLVYPVDRLGTEYYTVSYRYGLIIPLLLSLLYDIYLYH